MDIRVITNPNSKRKSVVLLVPTLVNLPDDEMKTTKNPQK
ncbi:hypothetical protein RDI58_008572 [Solanum bulbocastanum]|uniref:Uncharacterized protein n=1 Tax=Solanum bulbocastanum TaxID=147425 RepID=A0AAN8TXE1_SOLBU